MPTVNYPSREANENPQTSLSSMFRVCIQFAFEIRIPIRNANSDPGTGGKFHNNMFARLVVLISTGTIAETFFGILTY